MSTRISIRFSILLLLVVIGSGCNSGGAGFAGRNWNLFAGKQRTWKPPVSDPVPQPTADQKIAMQMAIIRSMEQKKEFDQAVVACEELHKKYPKRADVVNRLAILYDKKGDPDPARRYHNLAVEREPKNADILCDRGYSHYLHGDFAEAENDYCKALKHNPRLPRAHNNLALLLAATNKQEAALTEFTRAGCSPAQARVNLAHALIWDEKWQAAEQHLLAALEMDPSLTAAEKSLHRLRALQAKRQTGGADAQQFAQVQRLPGTSTPPQLPMNAAPVAPSMSQLPVPAVPPSPIGHAPPGVVDRSPFVTQASNLERQQPPQSLAPSNVAAPVQRPASVAAPLAEKPTLQVLGERSDQATDREQRSTTKPSDISNAPSRGLRGELISARQSSAKDIAPGSQTSTAD